VKASIIFCLLLSSAFASAACTNQMRFEIKRLVKVDADSWLMLGKAKRIDEQISKSNLDDQVKNDIHELRASLAKQATEADARVMEYGSQLEVFGCDFKGQNN
jgi:hypothetical protein